MPNILVIDDVRIMDFECLYARNLEEAYAILFGNEHCETDWDEVYWDHDLGTNEDGEEITTRPLVADLEERYANYGVQLMPTIKHCYVHSSNGYGADWLIAGLQNAGYEVHRIDPPVIGYLPPQS